MKSAAARTITPEEQLAGVRSLLADQVAALAAHGKTIEDAIRAEHASRWRWGKARRRRCAWWGAAMAVASTVRHLEVLEAAQAAAVLEPLVVRDDDPPF